MNADILVVRGGTAGAVIAGWFVEVRRIKPLPKRGLRCSLRVDWFTEWKLKQNSLEATSHCFRSLIYIYDQ